MTDTHNWFRKAKAVRIEDVTAQRGIVLRGRVEREGPCPICAGTDRFSINTQKQVFNCRGCGKGGDVIDLIVFLDGCDRITAVTKLTDEPRPNGYNGSALEPGIAKQKLKDVSKDTPEDTARDANDPSENVPKKLLIATFEYTDETGAVIYVVDRFEFQNADGTFVLKDGKRKKTFRQRRPDPDHPGAWIANIEGITRVPYRLPEVIEAVAADHPVFVTEGEGKVDALRAIGLVATTNPMGAGKWLVEMSERLRGADVILLPDADELGWKHMNDVGASLVGVAARIRVVMLPDLPAKGDVKNWLEAGGTREQLDALVETAQDWKPSSEGAPCDEAKAKAEAGEQAIIDELSRLDPVAYDRRRNEAADQMGIRRGTLDGQVNARRAQRAQEEGPPPVFGHWVVEPWPSPVNTGELIFALVERVKRHVILSYDQALTVALWILFAWMHDTAAVHSPILLVTSPEANSGKTQLVSLVTHLVPRAVMGTGISEAALFRSIEKWQPTIIVDEADVLLIDNEPLRAVINSGWTRGSCVLRCIGENNEPHPFPTFCPKIVGMKGQRLPDTTMSRSIVIEMKRKKSSETVIHFRFIDDAGLAELRQRALRWANDNGEKLDGAEPDMPPGFDNRLGDNWSQLLAIADLAGDEWPTLARKAAAKLSDVAEASSTGVQLLADIRLIFDGPQDGFEKLEPLDAISSAELVRRLGADDGSRWHEFKGGKPLTQLQLARELKRFKIYPDRVTPLGQSQTRGYARAWFEDAWGRYLPSA
jgi:Protein of unknown function (DUF3631)/CHC2 zinc finger